MRRYVFLFILIIVFLISLGAKFQVENTFPLFGKFIILDPGHGYLDPGSIYKDEYEKDYNLTFAGSLKKVLESCGATVILTREGDYDLSSPTSSRRKRSDFNNRIKLINEDKPDLYLSLHMNSLESSKYYGAQAFYSDVKPQNETFAKIVQEKMNLFFDYDKDYKKIPNDKYMFNKIEVTGILIEYGFMSSPRDRENLKNETYRQSLSEAIAFAIVEYLNGK